MSPTNIRSAIVILLFVILIFCAACWRKPEKPTAGNFGPAVFLPKSTQTAAIDPEAQKESAVIVSVLADGEFFVGANQFPEHEIGKKVSRLLVAQAEANRVVYLAGSDFLDYGIMVNVIDNLRKEGVARIGLLMQPAGGGNGRSSLPVNIAPEPDPSADLSKFKPDPLTLVVSINKDLKLELNREPMGEASEPRKLALMLMDIFQSRKQQHVYKPGMETRNDVREDERVEKTVVIRASRSTRYGDVVRLVDAVKAAGANPIVLQIDDLAQ